MDRTPFLLSITNTRRFSLFSFPISFDEPVNHFLLFRVRHGCPLEKHPARDFILIVIDAGGEGIRKRSFVGPRVEGPSTGALGFPAKEESVPSPLVDRPGGVMKQFTCTERGVAGLGETHLESINFRVVHKIIRGAVTARGRRELAGENRCPGGCAVDPGGVRVSEKYAPVCQLVEIRGDCTGTGSHAPEPVIHVIDGEEEDVWFPSLTGQGKAGEQEDDDEGENGSHDLGRGRVV